MKFVSIFDTGWQFCLLNSKIFWVCRLNISTFEVIKTLDLEFGPLDFHASFSSASDDP